jgi:hypothetical protein
MTERWQASGSALVANVPVDTGAVPPSPAVPSAAVGPSPNLPPALVLPPAVPSGGLAQPAVATASPAAAMPASPDATAAEEVESNWREGWRHLPSWMTSMVVHLALVLVLALLSTVQRFSESPESMVVSAEGNDGAGGTAEEMLPSELLPASGDLEPSAAIPLEQLPELPPGEAMANVIGPISAELPKADDLKLGGGGKRDASIALAPGPGGGGAGEGNSLSLRLNGSERSEAVRRGGGTQESEYAVQQALHWLAEHQNYDGSWTFEHQKSPKCHGSCGNPGYAPGKIAATSLALLPFLGTGQTHQDGEYKRKIEQGLRFLVRSMQLQGDQGSLYEMGGQMYGHGLASIVLCEAFGMTHDQSLHVPAQAAVNFIVAAQDSNGGGWRYRPGEPGDTSVVGWQLMALKSAQMAYLHVPQMTMRKAGYFLDYVQSERGATYGYQEPSSRRPATTAIGLLGRMYLGWQHDNLALQHGVQILGQLGPSTDQTDMKNNMYYNYYATQVMHHYGGYPWQRWNAVMRDYLIRSQAKGGHENGSWFLGGSDHGAPAGGRLYCTAMAAMTLEVYYRYMPLYRDQSTRP